MYSATYRRELDETVARESAHLWANDAVRVPENHPPTTESKERPARARRRKND
jgi:hypothetical protein